VIDVLAAMLIVVVADGSVAPSLFRWRPLSYLGKISYGVYIFHYPLTRLSEPIAAAVVPWPRLVHLGSSAIDLVATLLVASASFRWLEQPFLSLKDKWFLSVRAPTQPGALETPAFEPDAGRVSAEAPE
jgi:peptidoglycan/LPS O-acetylase OafA/YrhL